MSTGKNAAENYMQRKNQFARFRILQTEVGEHAIIMCMSFILLGNADVSNLSNMLIRWQYFWSRTRKLLA